MFVTRTTLTRALLALAPPQSMVLSALLGLRGTAAALLAFTARRPMMLLSALSAQRSAAGSSALTAATSAVRMMFPQGFQRLRQFTLIKFAVFIRVEIFHQVFSQLFRAWVLMLSTLTTLLCALGLATLFA